jgi:protein TonB
MLLDALDLDPEISRESRPLRAAGLWPDAMPGDRASGRRRAAYWLVTVAAHLAVAALFLAFRAPEDVPERDSVAVELVVLPRPPSPRAALPRPAEIKEAPRPSPPHQRAIRQPPPKLDLPAPMAVPVPPVASAMPVPPVASAMPVPSVASAPAAVTPPSPPAQAAPPQAYLGALYAHLALYKRYPRALQTAGIQGVALLRFTLDRQGRVLAHRIERSSGHAALADEAESMIERAQPLPKPPADMADPVDIAIPVQFTVK